MQQLDATINMETRVITLTKSALNVILIYNNVFFLIKQYYVFYVSVKKLLQNALKHANHVTSKLVEVYK